MAGRGIGKEKALPGGSAFFMSASFLSEAFFELSEFFTRYFGIGKYLLIRFSCFQHRGGYFLSGNLFDRCDIRHGYLLLLCHRTHFSDEFVSCLDAGEGDDPVDEVEERLKFLGCVAFCYSKAQKGDFEELLRLVVAPFSSGRRDWRVPLQGRRAPGSSRSGGAVPESENLPWAGRGCVWSASIFRR